MKLADPRLEAGFVRVSVDGPRADVRLVRPEARNAQTPATWRALAAVGELLAPDVRVVVLSAEGASFSAGLDRRMLDGSGVPGEPALADLARMPAAQLDATIEEYQQGFTWWRESPAVTIAAVQGHAVGAGFQLALACDLMICADDAQLAMRETSLGLVPDLGGTAPLLDAVGYGRALEICATGRWVRAAEAADLGIAQAVVPAAALASSVDDLVAALLAAPAGALVATKRLLGGARGRSRAEQRTAERAEQGQRLAELARLLA
ncbi:MAG: enoyl-CoA hydratase/isomerase family protein [Jiangellales bacterium]